MNIESMTVRNVGIYPEFGWIHTEDVRKRGNRGHHYTLCVLVRDKEMAHYHELVDLENQYFSLKARIKPDKKIDGLNCIIFFLLLVFPLIIYLSYINKKNTEIDQNNMRIDRQMREILDKARSLR